MERENAKTFGYNIAAGVVTSFVFLHLDKQGLTTPAYTVFIAYLATLCMIFVRAIRRPASTRPPEKQDQKMVDEAIDGNVHQAMPEIFHQILALIAKYHSQGIAATPTLIAADLNMDPGIALAHMRKYHNDQFITYLTSDADKTGPHLNTPFSLSSNAWQHIKVVRV